MALSKIASGYRVYRRLHNNPLWEVEMWRHRCHVDIEVVDPWDRKVPSHDNTVRVGHIDHPHMYLLDILQNTFHEWDSQYPCAPQIQVKEVHSQKKFVLHHPYNKMIHMHFPWILHYNNICKGHSDYQGITNFSLCTGC